MTQHVFVGIDVSKDSLDLHALPDGAHARFPNDQSGIRKVVAWVKEHITLPSGIDHNPHQHVNPGYCGEW